MERTAPLRPAPEGSAAEPLDLEPEPPPPPHAARHATTATSGIRPTARFTPSAFPPLRFVIRFRSAGRVRNANAACQVSEELRIPRKPSAAASNRRKGLAT